MQEIGKIVEVMGNTTKVEVAQKEMCQECPSQNFCKLTAGNSRTIEVLNEVGAKLGDIVKIELSSKGVLMSAFLTYIFPILVLLAVGGLTQWISASQNMAIITGTIAFAFSFLIVYFINKKINKKLTPVIKEIVQSDK